MDDKAIQTYVLNIAEELGIRNEETRTRVADWDKDFMLELVQQKVQCMRSEQAQHSPQSDRYTFIETQIGSVEEVRSAINSRH